MFGCLGFVLNPLAIWLLWGTPHTVALKVAIGSLAAHLWGYGIAANFRENPQQMPDYAVWLSMASLVTAVVLVGYALVAG